MSPPPCRSASPAGAARPGRWLLALALALLLSACSSPPQRPPSAAQAQAAASSERATQAAQRGDWRQAEQQYQVALQAAVALQDPARTGAALLGLAQASARQGDLAAAHGHLDRLLADPSGIDPGQRASAAARKALLALDQGPPADARRWIEQAERDCAAPCALAPLLGNLRAHLALAQGDAVDATAHAQAAGAAAAAAGQAGEQAAALRLQARAAGQLGLHGQAAEALARALQIDRQLGQPDRIALDLTLAGEAEDRRGQAAAATVFYQRALAVYGAIGDTAQAALLRQRLAGR